MTLNQLQILLVKCLNNDIKIVNQTSEAHFDADNIQLVLPQKYTEQQLEDLLND